MNNGQPWFVGAIISPQIFGFYSTLFLLYFKPKRSHRWANRAALGGLLGLQAQNSEKMRIGLRFGDKNVGNAGVTNVVSRVEPRSC